MTGELPSLCQATVRPVHSDRARGQCTVRPVHGDSAQSSQCTLSVNSPIRTQFECTAWTMWHSTGLLLVLVVTLGHTEAAGLARQVQGVTQDVLDHTDYVEVQASQVWPFTAFQSLTPTPTNSPSPPTSELPPRPRRSPYQPSVQWNPHKPTPKNGCFKRYNKRLKRWMRRSCHFKSKKRKTTTTPATTTTTTVSPPSAVPRNKKKCYKRYNGRIKKYITKCSYW